MRGQDANPQAHCFMRIVVATYNVHRCIGLDGRHDAGRTRAVLREINADVVALQEIEWRAQDALHTLNQLSRDTGYEFIAGPTLLRGDGHFGNALLTRLALRRVSRADLSVPGREARGVIDAVLETGGSPLRVLATHLGLRAGERRAQMRRLLSLLEGTVPTVLMGDLNEWFLWGRSLRWLRGHFGTSPAPATFPSRRPVFALDRIWAEPRGILQDIRVHHSALARIASDHLPLVGVLDLSARNGNATTESNGPAHGEQSPDARSCVDGVASGSGLI